MFKKIRSWVLILFIILLALFTFILPWILHRITNIPRSKTGYATGTNSKLSFVTPLTVSLNQTFTASLLMDTDNIAISGVDIILHFDNTMLNLIDINPVAIINTTLKTYLPVNNLGVFDKNTVINNANSNGLIKFGIGAFILEPTPTPPTITNSYTGNSTIAILTFQSKKLGQTMVNFDYTPGLSTDTNLVSNDQLIDILGSIGNLIINIENPTPTIVITITPSSILPE